MALIISRIVGLSSTARIRAVAIPVAPLVRTYPSVYRPLNRRSLALDSPSTLYQTALARLGQQVGAESAQKGRPLSVGFGVQRSKRVLIFAARVRCPTASAVDVGDREVGQHEVPIDVDRAFVLDECAIHV